VTRRFPPPWSIEEMDAYFIVRDRNGRALAYVLFRGGAGKAGGQATHPDWGIAPCNAELRDCVTCVPNSICSILSEVQGRIPMSHPTKRKRGMSVVPVLSAAGLSLSVASGASAAIGKHAAGVLTPKTEMSHEITLCEEEISDVSLATFYIFDNQRAGTSRRGLKLAQGCGGCGCMGKKRSLWWGGDGGYSGCSRSTYSIASPVGRYGNPPRYSTKSARKYAKAAKRRHVPK
jgi:hypothetical protein